MRRVLRRAFVEGKDMEGFVGRVLLNTNPTSGPFGLTIQVGLGHVCVMSRRLEGW